MLAAGRLRVFDFCDFWANYFGRRWTMSTSCIVYDGKKRSISDPMVSMIFTGQPRRVHIQALAKVKDLGKGLRFDVNDNNGQPNQYLQSLVKMTEMSTLSSASKGSDHLVFKCYKFCA